MQLELRHHLLTYGEQGITARSKLTGDTRTYPSDISERHLLEALDVWADHDLRSLMSPGYARGGGWQFPTG